MKKRFLSMILAIAMIASIFAGIAVTASAAEGNYELADAIVAGDTVILASKDGAKVFTGISSKNIGDIADATPAGTSLVSAEAAALKVVAGSVEGSVAFEMADGTYIGLNKDANNLFALEGVSDETSWTVTITEGAAVVVNVARTARVLQYNSGSPRFCAYKGTQQDVSFYKLSDGCNHADATSEVVTAPTCVETGVAKYTCSCGETWEVVVDALGHTFDEGVVTVEPTCVAEGSKLFTCKVCEETKTEPVATVEHNYVDGVCTVCEAVEAETVRYALVDPSNIVEGNYIIGAIRADAFPTVYAATAKVSGDWTVSNTSVVAVDNVISSDELPEDAQVVVFTGNNTDGFAIGFEVDGVMKYLGYSDSSANRKLALNESYANILWIVSEEAEGGFRLTSEFEGGKYYISQNSTTATAIRGYSGSIYGKGIYLFAEVDENPCLHENTSEIPAVEATCTTDGNTAGVKCEDCGKVISGNEKIPAYGHKDEIAVVDGKVIVACTVCGEGQEVVLNTIAEAKAYTDTTVVYNVKGVVTYVNGRTIYIEDENDALCVYFPVNFDTSALKLGDEIFVSAPMTVYKGLLEMNGPETYYVLSEGNALPENTTVTLADLLADTTNTYLGERVTISDLTVGVVNEAGSTMLTDASGNSIALHKATGLGAIAYEGCVVKVTVIVSAYNSYQLIVNPSTISTDIVVISEPGTGSDPIEVVSIADAKLGSTGEYYKVEGIVTAMSADMRTIYIQDSTGGIALYLSAKPSEAVCAIGDQVRARGAWKLYNGLIELSDINASDVDMFEVVSNGNTVEAQLVEIVDLAVDTDNEYLAEKVRIEGAVITAIASNGTVTLDQNGTTITIFKAPALNEGCVVGALVNVTAVVSAYNGYQLLINGAADVELVVCEHAETVVLEAVAATCTTDGLTEGAKCALCGVVTIPQEVVPALGHAYTTVNNGDGTHTTTCGNCNDTVTEACTYEDGVCTACGSEEPSAEPIEITMKLGHTLNLASDISINYAVTQTALNAYDSYYVECVIPNFVGNVQEGTTVVTIEPTVNGNYYYFTLTGLTAIQMNDMIEARLYMTKGNEKYVTNVDTYSVATYAYNQIRKVGSVETLKALCADLLRYGAWAQTYKNYRTDALVDADMTEDDRAYLSDMEAVTFNNNKVEQSDFENPATTWQGRSLDLGSKVVVKFVFSLNDASINVEDLTAKITYENYEGKTVSVTLENAYLYNASRGYYAFDFEALLAAELRSVLSAVIYNGETRISTTLNYSVDTYGIGRTGTLLSLCKALIAYSDTALAYFGK